MSNKIHKRDGWGSTKCGLGLLHERGAFAPTGLWKDVTCKRCLSSRKYFSKPRKTYCSSCNRDY
jgi:hypothetical protein